MRFPLVLATANADKAREICEILSAVCATPLASVVLEAADGETVGYLVAPSDSVEAHAEAVERLAHAPDVEETGATLEENARIKAEGVGRALGVAAIADDTGLEVDALGGAPGVHSARFAGPDASYDDNVAALLAALATVDGLDDPARRRARFTTVALAWRPDADALVARGQVEGEIISEVRGDGGFGYDPVFVPIEGDGRTFAEMTPPEKHAVSHRSRAFRALAARLSEED